MKITSLAALLVFSLACRSATPSKRLERMFVELHEEIGEGALHASKNDDWWSRQNERLKTVRELVAAKQVQTATENLHAAVILVETDSESDLACAHELALTAAELGDPRGFRVAAEALDKLCVKRQLAQKYGTQYVYEPVLRAWRLYPVDPATTDGERAAMGVEPLEKLKAREAELNRAMAKKP